ncbi:MAG: hypothetical protein ACMUIA_07815 [bacterium]
MLDFKREAKEMLLAPLIIFGVALCSALLAPHLFRYRKQKDSALLSIPGSYASVSESEWHQILKLNNDGTAELMTISKFPAGDNEEGEKIKFSWSYEPPYVKLKSEGKAEILEYSKDINLFEYFEIEGFHEGLKPVRKHLGEGIVYTVLWKEPRTFLTQ